MELFLLLLQFVIGKYLNSEVDPVGRTTGTAFLIGNLAVPIS